MWLPPGLNSLSTTTLGPGNTTRNQSSLSNLCDAHTLDTLMHATRGNWTYLELLQVWGREHGWLEGPTPRSMTEIRTSPEQL